METGSHRKSVFWSRSFKKTDRKILLLNFRPSSKPGLGSFKLPSFVSSFVVRSGRVSPAFRLGPLRDGIHHLPREPLTRRRSLARDGGGCRRPWGLPRGFGLGPSLPFGFGLVGGRLCSRWYCARGWGVAWEVPPPLPEVCLDKWCCRFSFCITGLAVSRVEN